MAEKKATLLIEIRDFATAKLKGLGDVFLGLKLGAEAFRQTFGRVIGFLSDSLKSFSDSEVAVNRLNTALKNQGTYSDEYSASLQKTASELQKVTTFSDEAIMGTQSLLSTFGLAGDKLDSTTKAAMNLSTGLGIDLRTATLMLGKAWAGETGTLSRYGIKVDESKNATEKFADVMKQVEGRFGGSAQAALNTYSGRVENLKNRFDDLKEKVGKELVPVMEFWVAKMNLAMGAVEKMTQGENIQAKFVDKNTEALRQRIEVLIAQRDAIAGTKFILFKEGSIAAVQAEIDRLTAGLEKTQALGRGELAKQEQAAAPESKQVGEESATVLQTTVAQEEIAKRIYAAQNEQIEMQAIRGSGELNALQNMGLHKNAVDTLRTQEMAAELEALGQHNQAKLMLDKQASINSETVAKGRAQMLMGHLAMIASLSSAKSKALQVIGKIAAANMAIMNTAMGVTQALAWYPPPISFIMAAAVAAAGAVQIGTIAGVQMAEGGMLMPTAGGVPAIMAEVGKAEVAIPLDDERTKEKLRDTFDQGGGTNVTIQAGVVVADSMSVKQFARMIDEELFKLGRVRQRIS